MTKKVERNCGDCIVCCVYSRIDVPEFQKESMTHCPHLKLPGPIKENTIYYSGAGLKNCKVFGTDKHPKCCTDYDCAWKKGHGLEEDRPDRTLILFDAAHHIDNALEAKPLKEFQEETEEGKEVIDRMSKSTKMPVIVLNFYERTIQRIVGRGIDE